jgi:hypothetical protein
MRFVADFGLVSRQRMSGNNQQGQVGKQRTLRELCFLDLQAIVMPTISSEPKLIFLKLKSNKFEALKPCDRIVRHGQAKSSKAAH